MWLVINDFADLQDNNHAYSVGDKFPHGNAQPSEKRIAELAGSDNKRGMPLIKAVCVEKPQKTRKKK